MNCPVCQNPLNTTSAPGRHWCPTCKSYPKKPKAESKPQLVEYIKILKSGKLHLRSKGFRTRCGINFWIGYTPCFHREVPENACKTCQNLKETK